jgi:hypothetical protein
MNTDFRDKGAARKLEASAFMGPGLGLAAKPG